MNSKILVLIIEDDPPIENFLVMAMNTQGYKTITAATGESGISLAASWNPDIILLDLGLPDIDGIDVIGRIRAICQSPIIIVSARHLDHDKVYALDSGADDYIAKPFSVPELLARIRVALRHKEKEDLDIDLENWFIPKSRPENRLCQTACHSARRSCAPDADRIRYTQPDGDPCRTCPDSQTDFAGYPGQFSVRIRLADLAGFCIQFTSKNRIKSGRPGVYPD